MTLSVGAGRAATPGVETIVSALDYLSPGEWTLAAGGFLVGAFTVALARTRGPREDLVSREIRRSAERHRAADSGFITFTLAGAVLAGCGLYIVLTAEDSAVRAVAVVMAVVGGAAAVVDLVRSRRR